MLRNTASASRSAHVCRNSSASPGAASDGDAILQAAQKLFWWAAGNARQALAARHTWPVAVILRQIAPKYLAILARERPAIGCGAVADPALAKRQRQPGLGCWGFGRCCYAGLPADSYRCRSSTSRARSALLARGYPRWRGTRSATSSAYPVVSGQPTNPHHTIFVYEPRPLPLPLGPRLLTLAIAHCLPS